VPSEAALKILLLMRLPLLSKVYCRVVQALMVEPLELVIAVSRAWVRREAAS
jgi:hypothetical protein